MANLHILKENELNNETFNNLFLKNISLDEEIIIIPDDEEKNSKTCTISDLKETLFSFDIKNNITLLSNENFIIFEKKDYEKFKKNKTSQDRLFKKDKKENSKELKIKKLYCCSSNNKGEKYDEVELNINCDTSEKDIISFINKEINIRVVKNFFNKDNILFKVNDLEYETIEELIRKGIFIE